MIYIIIIIIIIVLISIGSSIYSANANTDSEGTKGTVGTGGVTGGKEPYVLHMTPENLEKVNNMDRELWVSDSFNSPYKYGTVVSPGCSVTCRSKCLQNFI